MSIVIEPKEIDEELGKFIDASFENGVLNIVIPKAEENKRTIEIH